MKHPVFLIVFCSLLFSCMAYAQDDMQDVIYLKNGTTHRGTIIENVHAKHVRLRTQLGSTFTYQWDEIEKITRERKLNVLPKSPGTALAMSAIFPGMGQFYNEQPKKGASFVIANILGFVLLYAGVEDNVQDSLGSLFESQVFLRDAGNDDELAAVGFMILLGSWSLSMLDAYHQAERINQRYLDNRRAIRMSPITAADSFGVRVAFRF